MTLSNIAIVFAPNIFRTDDPLEEVENV